MKTNRPERLKLCVVVGQYVIVSTKAQTVFLYKSPTEHLFVIPEQNSGWNLRRKKQIAIKFLIQMQKTTSETHEMIKAAYREDVLCCGKFCEFNKKFKDLRLRPNKAKL